jgi:CRP-like cAMP-binding protein
VLLPHSREEPMFTLETTSNRLLSRLSSADFGLLSPHLTRVDLPVRKKLEIANKPIGSVYFPESGFASVVSNGSGKPGIEVGLIGREGMTGLSIIMGTDRSTNETFIQLAGAGLCISAPNLLKTMDPGSSLHRCFLLYAHAFSVQTTNTAIANGRGKIEERLARWLLMARDRADSDDIALTHEFLSLMLGVRRSGVTVALHLLEKQGAIHAHRGTVTIVDRLGLEDISNGAYGTPEAEFQRLFA